MRPLQPPQPPRSEPAARHSLLRRIARWVLPPLALVVATSAILAYFSALETVNRAYDRSLGASLRAIAEGTYSLEGEIRVDIPATAFDLFTGDLPEQVFYAVRSPAGELVTGYDDLRPPEGLAGAASTPQIGDAHYRGQPVRIAVLRKRLYDPALSGGDAATIVFAETISARVTLARELFLDNLKRQALLIGLGLILLLIAIRSALRPLAELQQAVGQRAADDLTPIHGKDIPAEVQPLIDAINRHTERLTEMFAARRRFLADAAHQMRTPLAVLTTQAEVGLRQAGSDAAREAFTALLATIRSTRRMADQMLALSQAEHADALARPWSLFDLGELARDTLAECTPVALRRNVDLAFDGTGITRVHGDRLMLRELLANLIDNALQYAPAGSEVVVSTWEEDGAAALAVSDAGIGIPAAERDKVFQRFYRVLGQAAPEGSGLGLAIVREIAGRHGARVTLQDGPTGRGLRVAVHFPAHAPHPRPEAAV